MFVATWFPQFGLKMLIIDKNFGKKLKINFFNQI